MMKFGLRFTMLAATEIPLRNEYYSLRNDIYYNLLFSKQILRVPWLPGASVHDCAIY